MTKDDGQSSQLNLTVVALVALVAIVGLVALVLNTASLAKISTGGTPVYAAGEEDLLNVVGAAGSACAGWAENLCKGRTGRNCKEYYTSLCQGGSSDGSGWGSGSGGRVSSGGTSGGGAGGGWGGDSGGSGGTVTGTPKDDCASASSIRSKRCMAQLQ